MLKCLVINSSTTKINNQKHQSLAPCDSPNQLTTRDITATSAILDWVYDGACAAAGLVTGYRLTYTSHGIPTELDIPDVQTTETQLDQLTPETTYRVEVLALTSDGKNSPPSDRVEFTTEHDSGRSHNFEPFSCRSKTPFYLLKPISRVFFNYTLEIDSGSLRSSTLLYVSCF